MSIKSTYAIKRDLAKKIILSKIHTCTDTELERILEAFEESYLRNYIITDDLNKINSFNIKTIKEFDDESF